MTTKRTQQDVVMPKLGMTMQEATILEWHAQDGDWIEKGDVLFTIETEKAALDIEAPASGTLQILMPAGQTVPVKERVARLLQSQERASEEPSGSGREMERTQEEGPRPEVVAEEIVPASPKARAMAHREGVSLTEIDGTGPRGMIVVADVERMSLRLPFSKRKQTQEATRPDLIERARHREIKVSPIARRVAAEAGLDDLSGITGTGPRGRVMREDVERALVTERTSSEEPAPEMEEMETKVRPLSGPRAVTAERLSISWRERPHVTLTTEADASNLVGAREQLAAELEQKVSYNAFLVMLVSRALREHPYMNARFTEEGVEELPQINVGVAVDTERGLLVPVVRDPGSKDLLEIEETLRQRLRRAKTGNSLPDELTGSTFTITNLGMYDVDAFTPIINPPESAILGLGRIVAKPVVVDGQVVVRDRMTLSLSFDHRVVDGGPAARFLQRVKQLVERPFALLCVG